MQTVFSYIGACILIHVHIHMQSEHQFLTGFEKNRREEYFTTEVGERGPIFLSFFFYGSLHSKRILLSSHHCTVTE